MLACRSVAYDHFSAVQNARSFEAGKKNEKEGASNKAAAAAPEMSASPAAASTSSAAWSSLSAAVVDYQVGTEESKKAERLILTYTHSLPHATNLDLVRQAAVCRVCAQGSFQRRGVKGSSEVRLFFFWF
jgi:hypothetical protein